MIQNVMHGISRTPLIEKVKAVFMQEGEQGTVYAHERLEQALGFPRTDPRYYGVVSAARRQFLRETGISLVCERGVGYRYPTGHQQLRQGVNGIRRGARTIYRGFKVVDAVADHRLPVAKDREIRDQLRMKANHLMLVARTERKAMELTIGRPEPKPQLAERSA